MITQIEDKFGSFDVFFGKSDGLPQDRFSIDNDVEVKPTVLADWKLLPFRDEEFSFGFWDPPYDRLYRPELREIARVCRHLALLHEFVQPLIADWEREAVIAVTMGPNRRLRCLQVWRRGSKGLT